MGFRLKPEPLCGLLSVAVTLLRCVPRTRDAYDAAHATRRSSTQAPWSSSTRWLIAEAGVLRTANGNMGEANRGTLLYIMSQE